MPSKSILAVGCDVSMRTVVTVAELLNRDFAVSSVTAFYPEVKQGMVSGLEALLLVGEVTPEHVTRYQKALDTDTVYVLLTEGSSDVHVREALFTAGVRAICVSSIRFYDGVKQLAHVVSGK
jgi:hypothetical protein